MCPNPQEIADLVKFTEEILNGKFYFCGVVISMRRPIKFYHCYLFSILTVAISETTMMKIEIFCSNFSWNHVLC